MTDKPLVSFCVKCYNQREYIGAALDGAFSQTYRPLEIVISDDCSTDGSIGIIQQKIDAYKAQGGDIPIIFNSNEKNLGNVGSWMVFGKLAKGELFIKADGDDISLSERTETIVEAWLGNGKKATVIDHVAAVMTDDGVLTGSTLTILGAAQAYSRKCWDGFPIAGEEPGREWGGDDTIFSIRAYALAGPEDYQLKIDDVLVNYRYGCGGSTSYKTYRDRYTTFARECIMYGLRDVELNSDFLNERNVAMTKEWCLSRVREEGLNKLLAFGKTMKDRARAALSLRKEFGYTSIRDTIYQCLLTLPPLMSDPMLNFYLRHIRRP